MIRNTKHQITTEPPLTQNPCCVPVPCYNCGSIEKDFYLVKGDYLLADVDFPEKVEGEEVEIEICKNCEACQ